MTVENIPRIVKYEYTGVGDYSFDFRILEEIDIAVSHVDENGEYLKLDRNTDYTVVKNALPQIGGVVTVSIPSIQNGLLAIFTEAPLSQPTQWGAEGYVNLEKLEQSFDKCIMLLQQMQEIIDSGSSTSDWRGPWVTDTVYRLKDIVIAPNRNWYRCITAHTSAASFNTDLTSGYWIVVLDISYMEQLAQEAASSAAEASSAAASAESDRSIVEPLAATVVSSAAQVAINLSASQEAAASAITAAADAVGIVMAGARVDSMSQDQHTATAGQTNFSMTEAAGAANILVFLNSRKMRLNEDYTLNSQLAASVVTLTTPASGLDELDIISFNAIIPEQPLIDYPSVAYNPSWTASVSNPVIGNGVLLGESTRSGGKASVLISLVIGSTTTFGSGRWRFSLPITPETETGETQAFPVFLTDLSGMPAVGFALIVSGQAYFEIALPGSLDYIDGALPWIWAAGDALKMSFTYIL